MATDGEVRQSQSLVARIRMKKIQDGTLIKDSQKDNDDKEKKAP